MEIRGRIAAQVLTGIGFLGAGAIIQSHGSVHGLTTAACIWVMAVVGLALVPAVFLAASITTAFTLFVLVSLEGWSDVCIWMVLINTYDKLLNLDSRS